MQRNRQRARPRLLFTWDAPQVASGSRRHRHESLQRAGERAADQQRESWASPSSPSTCLEMPRRQRVVVGDIDTCHYSELVNVPLISESMGDCTKVAEAIGLKDLPASYAEYITLVKASRSTISTTSGSCKSMDQYLISEPILAFYLLGDASQVGELELRGIDTMNVALLSETSLPYRGGQAWGTSQRTGGMLECRVQPVWGELGGNPGRRPKNRACERVSLTSNALLHTSGGRFDPMGFWRGGRTL